MYWRDRDKVEFAEIDRLVPLDGKRVLDVGCGTGRLTIPAAARAERVYAFDPDTDAVSIARKSLPTALRRRVSFAAHGAEALDMPRRRFDVALCGWSL